jgi:putative tricarboxylic transport membrane protein
MLLANFMFLGIGLAGAKLFSRVTLIPKNILWPAVFVFAVIGSFAFASSVFDVWVMMVAGVVGFFMNRHGFGPAPLVMGLILGNLVEESFSQSMIIYDNEWWRLFEGPIVNLFFAFTALSLFWPLVRRFVIKK